MKILIIGGGISGTSTAIHLRRMGVEVTLLDHKALNPHPVFKPGESLPPDALKLIQELGITEQFKEAGHLPCYNNKSAWGSDQISFQDFITHPAGHGWHIDRIDFEKTLVAKCHNAGVRVLESVIIQKLSYEGETWKVVMKTKPGVFSKEQQFDFIVDASGRSNWLAGKLGVKRIIEDKQLALIIALKQDVSKIDSSSLIESTSEGWWYSAAIPKDRLVLNFYCTPDNEQRKHWLAELAWLRLLSETVHTKKRLSEDAYELVVPVRFVSADTSILEKLYGPGWLAVGDAAMTYDPIASHGMTMAMVGARDASKLILEYLNGRQDALVAYDTLLRSAFSYYCQQRRQIYASERRYKTRNYWSRQTYNLKNADH